MIRNEAEYQECIARLEQDRQHLAHQREALVEAGLTAKQIDKALEPAISFHEQLQEEVEWYEKIKRRDFGEIQKLTHLGQLLIALRIANSLSQQDLAQKLEVSASQVSRDERNEYRGITIERAQRILDAMNEEIVSRVVDKDLGPERLVAAGSR